MASSELLNDTSFKLRIKIGLILSILSDVQSKEFHRFLKMAMAKTKSVNSICSNTKVTCSKKNWTLGCCWDCDDHVKKIINYSKQNYRFEISQYWPGERWEMVRFYMNRGQKKNPNQLTSNTTDLSGLLNFIYHCSVPWVDKQNKDPTQKVGEARNAIMLSVTKRILEVRFFIKKIQEAQDAVKAIEKMDQMFMHTELLYAVIHSKVRRKPICDTIRQSLFEELADLSETATECTILHLHKLTENWSNVQQNNPPPYHRHKLHECMRSKQLYKNFEVPKALLGLTKIPVKDIRYTPPSNRKFLENILQCIRVEGSKKSLTCHRWSQDINSGQMNLMNDFKDSSEDENHVEIIYCRLRPNDSKVKWLSENENEHEDLKVSLESIVLETCRCDKASIIEMFESNLEDTDFNFSLSSFVYPIESDYDEVSSSGQNYTKTTAEIDDFYSLNSKLNAENLKNGRVDWSSFRMVCRTPSNSSTMEQNSENTLHLENNQFAKSLTNTFKHGSDRSKGGLNDRFSDHDLLREITWLPLDQLPAPRIDITIALVHSPAQKILERIAKGETVGAHESMKYEILRVCTFRHYPGEDKPFRILLASAGLYYASEGDEVVCYCCGLRKSGWTEVDKPLQIHEQMKPSCNFLVRNHDFNVAIPDLPAENVAKFRILDQIGDSSNAGATGNSQQRCKTGNIDTVQNLQYRVFTPPPKHPQYAELSVRLESFKNWPTNIPQTAQIMAECGYYYAGFGDCVRCFHCGIGLRHWTEDDHPWIEHARWSKDCAYLREMKGEEFIQNVHLTIDDEEEPEDLIPATPIGQTADMSQVTPSEESSQILLTDPAQSVLEMGYQPRIIKKAIDIILHDKGRSGISAQRIMETIFMLEERESTSNLQQGIDSMNISGASAGSITQSESSRNTDLKQSTAEEPKSQTTKTGKIPASDAVSQSHKSSEGKAKGKAVSGQTHGSLQGGTEVDKILSKQHETANALNSPNSSLEDRKQGVASGTSKPRDTTKIKDENKRLKEQTVCKICLDKPVAIVFLPCGHLVTCAECAPAMRKCPICRALVKGSVKAFMS